MNNFDDFIKATDSLVRMTEDSMLTHEDHREMMPKGLWLRDMATVNLTLPRRVGKTTYINKRARCADLIIVHNHEMKREYRNSPAQVVTISELNNIFRGGRSHQGFNRVYVDEPRLVFRDYFSIDELYSFFCGQYGHRVCANMFIMLGT